MAGPWDNSSEVITSTPSKGSNPWDNTSEVIKAGKKPTESEDHPEIQKFYASGGKKLPFSKSLGENTQDALNNAEISARGLPIIGQGIKRMFPESERIQDYRQQNPMTSKTYEAVGEYAPFLPVAKWANTGRNLIASMTAGGSATGIARGLDSLADPDKDKAEIMPDMFRGFGEGTLGPLAGKILSPGTKAAQMPKNDVLSSIKMRPGRVVQGAPQLGNVSDDVTQKLSELAKKAGSKAKDAAAPTAWDKAVKPLSSGMLATAGAMAFPPWGVGLGIAPFIPGMAKGTVELMKKYPNATWAHKPVKGAKGLTTAEILTAMTMGHGAQSTPETEQ